MDSALQFPALETLQHSSLFFSYIFNHNSAGQKCYIQCNPRDQSKKKDHFKCEHLQKKKYDEDNLMQPLIRSTKFY